MNKDVIEAFQQFHAAQLRDLILIASTLPMMLIVCAVVAFLKGPR